MLALLLLGVVSVGRSNSARVRTPLGRSGLELELLHEWTHVDYDWSSFPFTKADATQAGLYVPEHITVTGIKQWKDTLYVTTPRWLSGVTATLNTVVKIDGESLLRPFPSYEEQVVGNSSALQYTQSMEIDRRGRMWIIDIGRINLMEENSAEFSGAPKLWIWDIEGRKRIHEFVFPDHIASHKTSMLNDIFVDDVRNVAYISDTSGTGALLVYDLATDSARRWDSHRSLSFPPDPLPPYLVEGLDFNEVGPLPVDGLALVPHLDRIFYTALHGLQLYSVSAALLRDFSSADSAINADVLDHGQKTSQCDGLTSSEDGQLFMTMETLNAVHSFDVHNLTDVLQSNVETAHEVSADDRLYWPDTFGWATDAKGGLLVSSARLEMLFLGEWPADRVNTALFRIPIGTRSYQYALGR